MKVLKFGGTSVGSPENMRKVAAILAEVEGPKVVVLSAMSGTTNALVSLSNNFDQHENIKALESIDELEERYHEVISDLLNQEASYQEALRFLDERFEFLRSFAVSTQYSSLERKNWILAQGELISTKLFSLFLETINKKACLIPALDFMQTDRQGEPDQSNIALNLNQVFEEHSTCDTYITQGFICLDYLGKISNLDRGGSDYTASLIGAAIGADDIEIWTDIDGMHNNDPRFVNKTRSISEISFEEAAELAYFGAKILHPQSVFPAMEKNIPVWLKNTFKPEALGTKISGVAPEKKYTSVAAKDGITAIRIKSYRMLMAYGFLKSVFEIFERHHTSIDMITTSEVAVSLTIDDDRYLSQIIKELDHLGKVEIDQNQSIICIAGNFNQDNKGVSAPILEALSDVSVRMISYGGSEHHVSVLVDSRDKKGALQSLNKNLFNL